MGVEFEYDLDVNGRALKVFVEAEGNVYGHNYGEDADGNRGEWRIECDDLELTIKDARGNDITKKIEKNHEAEIESIEEEAIELLVTAYSERGSDHDE